MSHYLFVFVLAIIVLNGLLLNTPGVHEMLPLIRGSRKHTLGTDIKSPIAVVVPNDGRYKF